jgi:hypothetical protein
VERASHQEASAKQGDQIARIFAQWVIAYFGQFSENYRSRPHFDFLCSLVDLCVIFDNSLGHILGVFSNTHLVTLVPKHCSTLPTYIGNAGFI